MKTIKKVVTVTLACLAMAMLLAPFAPKARSQDISKPVFVVATEKLDGGPYARIVALVSPAGSAHIGIVLNKPSEYTLDRLFPDEQAVRAVKDFVYLGGVENRGAIVALYPAGSSPSPHSIEMLPGVWFVPDGAAVDTIIESTPNAARYFAGFMTWRPGQLADEIRGGYIIAIPADRGKLFLQDTSKLYDSLRRPKGHIES